MMTTITNFSDLELSEGPGSRYAEALTEDGEISVFSGIVTLDSDTCLTSIDVTLPDPVSPGDNYKRLQIVDLAGLAHTVTPDTPFGNGGAGEAVATFSGTVGDSLKLMAYGGFWYVTGKHQVTIAAS